MSATVVPAILGAGRLVLVDADSGHVANEKIQDIVDLLHESDMSKLSVNTPEGDATKNVVATFLKLSLMSTLSKKELESASVGCVSEIIKLCLEDQSLQFVNKSACIDGDSAPESLRSLLTSSGCSARLFYLFISLLKRTEVFLSIGGDDRLTISGESKANKYLSSTLPVVGLVKRGSCTCSTMSKESFLVADNVRCKFIKQVFDLLVQYKMDPGVDEKIEVTFDSMNQQLISRLKKALGIGAEGVEGEILLFPSGSDAEFLPLILALVRSQNLAKKIGNGGPEAQKVQVYNFVTAAGEVGSGTPNASSGKHFSVDAPKGNKQKVGDLLLGLNSDSIGIELVQYKPRNCVGAVDFKEEQLVKEVRAKLVGSCANSVALIHIVVGTKTGLIYPSITVVEQLQHEFGERVVVCVDACQLRCKLGHIADYTKRGFTTLITGSKFFCGPPFSGGVVIPGAQVAELEDYLKQGESLNVVPEGLCNYITKFEVPAGMLQLRSYLQPKSWINFGLHLRWSCALESIEQYCDLDAAKVQQFTVQWADRVRSAVKNAAPFLQLVQDPDGTGMGRGIEDEMVGSTNSIVSIAIHVPSSEETTRFLNFDECKAYHKLMTQQVTDGDRRDDALAVQCMLGQPVKLADNGFAVVRIALGAEMVIAALQQEKAVEDIFAEDTRIISKMAKLASSWSYFSQAAGVGGIPLTSMMSAIDGRMLVDTIPFKACNNNKVADVSSVCKALCHLFPSDGIGESVPEVSVIYDLDAIHSSIQSLKNAFATSSASSVKFNHCFAVKSCPLAYILHFFVKAGLGLETASLGEVKLALRAQCPPHMIVFDSPCKSRTDIDFALRNGISLNANSYAEIEKIRSCIEKMRGEGIIVGSKNQMIGVRINPLVGAGKISALSTATSNSKFGIPLCRNTDDEGYSESDIMALFQKHSFLNGIMCHVGSQGMPIELMSEGATRIAQLAYKIETACVSNLDTEPRVVFLDIGGGLSANYDSDEVFPMFSQYSDALMGIWEDEHTERRTIFTEFGKSLITKCGVISSKIEDVLPQGYVSKGKTTDKTIAKCTAVTHCGADLLLRTAYCPDKFSHRLVFLDDEKKELTTATRTPAQVTVAGPLCFSGDVLASDMMLPQPQAGDICIVMDAGANTISLFSRHCSRLCPAVYAFRTLSLSSQSDNTKKEVVYGTVIKRRETEDELCTFWG